VLAMLLYGINQFAQNAGTSRMGTLRMAFMKRLFLKTLSCDYKVLEDPKGQILYQKALFCVNNGDYSGISRIIVFSIYSAASILQIFIFSSVFAYLNLWIMLLLLAGGAVNAVMAYRTQDCIYKNRDKWSGPDKKFRYINSKAADFSYGKDIRLFHMAPWLIRHRDQQQDARSAWDQKEHYHVNQERVAYAITTLLRDGIAYLYLILQTGSKPEP
jgi:hypothetical protein